jgi:hypothetical protein
MVPTIRQWQTATRTGLKIFIDKPSFQPFVLSSGEVGHYHPLAQDPLEKVFSVLPHSAFETYSRIVRNEGT